MTPAAPGWEVAIAGADGARSYPVAAWATVRATLACGCSVDHLLAAIPAATGGLRVVSDEPHVVVPPAWRAELHDGELVVAPVVPVVVSAGARAARGRR
jgi:hypothetical protein